MCYGCAMTNIVCEKHCDAMATATVLRPGPEKTLSKTSKNISRCRNPCPALTPRNPSRNHSSEGLKTGPQQPKRPTMAPKVLKSHTVSKAGLEKKENKQQGSTQERCRSVYSIPDLDAVAACGARKAAGVGSVGISGPDTNNSSHPCSSPTTSTPVSNSGTHTLKKRNSNYDNRPLSRLPTTQNLPSTQIPGKANTLKSDKLTGSTPAKSRIPAPSPTTHSTLPRISKVVGKKPTQSTSTRAAPLGDVVPSPQAHTITSISKTTVKTPQTKALPLIRIYSESNKLLNKEQCQQPPQTPKMPSTEIPRRKERRAGPSNTLPKPSPNPRKMSNSAAPSTIIKTKPRTPSVPVLSVPTSRTKPNVAPYRALSMNHPGSPTSISQTSRTPSLRASAETVTAKPSNPSVSQWQPALHASVPSFETRPSCEWTFPPSSGGDLDRERWARMGSQSSIPLASCDRCVSSATKGTWTSRDLCRHEQSPDFASESGVVKPSVSVSETPSDYSSSSGETAIVHQPLQTISHYVAGDPNNRIAFDLQVNTSQSASCHGATVFPADLTEQELWAPNPPPFPLELCKVSLNSNMLDVLTPQMPSEGNGNTSWPATIHRQGMFLDQMHDVDQQHSVSSSVTTSPRSSLQSDPANDLGYSSEKLQEEEDEDVSEHNYLPSGQHGASWCNRAKSSFTTLEEAIVYSGRLNSLTTDANSHKHMDIHNWTVQNESSDVHDSSQIKDVDILDDLFKFVSKDRVFHVMIQKTAQGLGLSVTGGIEPSATDDKPPGPAPAWAGLIRIKKIFPHGAAWATGQLQPGDLLLAANQTQLTGLTNHEALEVLRTCPKETTLTVCRLPKETACRLGLEVPSENPDIFISKTLSPSHNMLTLQYSYSSLGEFEVTLTKVNGSLGFTLRKEDESVLGHYVRSLVKEPAISDGRLRAGDKILSVNNVDISSMSHKEAIAFLRRCPDTVTIRLFRDSALTPVSPTSPIEPEPAISFNKPKPLLRQEAQDLLHDLAARKQAESRGASPSSGRNGSGASTGSVTPSSPRRRRLTKTPSPDLATVARDRYGLEVFLSPLPNAAMTPLHESDSEKDTSVMSGTSNLSGEYFTPTGVSSSQKIVRPAFLNLNNSATKKQKFLFTPPQEDSSRTMADTLLERMSDCISPIQLDPCSEPREAGDGSTNSDSEFLSPELASYAVHDDTSKLEPLEPFSLSSEWTDLSIENEDKLSRTEDDSDVVDAAVGFTRHAPLGLSDRDKNPSCVNYSTETTKAITGPTKGLLKWKGVLFTPEEELPPSSLGEETPSLSEDHGEMSLDDLHVNKQGKVVVVELNKGWNSRLGFSVSVDGCKASVGAIYEDSVAAKDGRLKVGDEILKVNNDYVEGLSKEEIIDLLRKTRGPVSITVRQIPK